MAKRMSRRMRLEAAMEDAQSALDKLQEQIDSVSDIDEDNPMNIDFTAMQESINYAENLVSNTTSGVQELFDEIESWKDNMESANMTHLPKFDEVSECYDALETLIQELESIDWPSVEGEVDPDSLSSMLQDTFDSLENAIGEADNVSFPAMF